MAFFYREQVKNIEGLTKKRTELLFLSKVLAKAIRNKGLSSTNALLLNRVKDPNCQKKLLKKAIDLSLTSRELKQEIELLKDNTLHSSHSKIAQKLQKSLNGINSSFVEEIEEEQKKELIQILKDKLALLEDSKDA